MTRFLLAMCVALVAAGCADRPRVRPQPVAYRPDFQIQVHADSSLREMMAIVKEEYEMLTGFRLELTFDSSESLRERLEQGDAAPVFLSSDMANPQKLAARGGWQAPKAFLRNNLCALTEVHIEATSATLLATMLRSDVRLGVATPAADPSAVHVGELFRKAEALQPGALTKLQSKALRLTGAPGLSQPPADRNIHAWLMDDGRADIFLTYCTHAYAARREARRLKIVRFPPALQVGDVYGLTRRDDAHPFVQVFAALMAGAHSRRPEFKYQLGFDSP